MTLREKLQHAFAVDPPGPAEPTPDEQPAIDWFCRQVARRHLAVAGMIALEMSRPLNYIGSQLMQFAGPGVWALVRPPTYEHYKHFAAFLERRGSVDYLTRRIEELEREYRQRDREETNDKP